MGGTIIHTQAKEHIVKTGKKRTGTTVQYAPKTGKPREEADYGQFLHWTTETGRQELLKRQDGTVERLIKVLTKSLDSKAARDGLSLNTAAFAASSLSED